MLRHVSTHVPEPSRIYHSSQAKGDFSEFTWVQQTYVFFQKSLRLEYPTKVSSSPMPPVVVACDCFNSSVGRCLEILNIPSWELTYPLKMDGWNTTFLLGNPIFRCYVSFREGIPSCHWEVFHLGAASQSP